MTLFVTRAMLRAAGACHDQAQAFSREWPDGASATAANCRRAIELGLDLDWAAERLLSATALEAYEQATAAAFAEAAAMEAES